MAQYDRNIPVSFAGLKVDSMEDHVESFAAAGDIEFGYPVGSEPGDTHYVAMVTKDNCSLLFDADFVTGNLINGTVNGVAWAEVAFDTDQATTAAALVAAINALDGVTCVQGGTNRTFLIEMDDSSTITVTSVVTGGASQAVGTPTYSSDNIFRGIALHQHNEAKKYQAKDTVSVMRKGKAWSEVSVAVTADETAYVDVAAGTKKFTNVSTDNLATGGVFRSSTAGAGIAQVEINLP